MSFSTRKVAKFTLPDNVQSFIVEGEPDQDFSIEDYEIKPENGIKVEPEDDPELGKDMDIDGYVANNTSTPYLDLFAETDVQAGAEEDIEVQPAQESTSVSATPTVPIMASGLGNSILQVPKVKLGNVQTEAIQAPKVTIGGIQSQATKTTLLAAQDAFFAQMRAYRPSADSEEDDLENQEEREDPLAFEHEFLKEKNVYEQKKQSGQLTQHEDTDFMILESKYYKRKQDFFRRENIDDTLFISEDIETKTSKKRKSTTSDNSSHSENEDVAPNKNPSKRAKTTKSRSRKSRQSRRKSQPPASLDLNATTNNFWENANAAQQMNDEATIQGGKDRNRAVATTKRNLPVESKAAAIRDGKRLTEAMKKFTSKKGDTTRNYSIEMTESGLRVKGMTSFLKPYQAVTAGWMRFCESDESDVKGGIIAHQMGLGKTVTCLANMTNGRPLKGQAGNLPHSATTLVVLPSSTMITQWKSEIALHTTAEDERKNWGLGSVFLFRDSMKEDAVPKDFGHFDVVLATYDVVRRSWPDCEYPKGLPVEERDAYFQKNFAGKLGPLHKYKFLRVVLDEGHKISNPETKVANACFKLQSDYRWILTGTPMANGAKDLYSLLCFIKHPSTLDKTFEAWKSQYCDPKNPTSLTALSHILEPHFSCWAQNDKFMGATLVRLPKPRNLPLELFPDMLENEMYEIFRERFKARAQTLDEEGNVQSARFHIFAMYTFLRQMTAHPLLVSSKVCDYLEMSDFDKLEEAVNRQVASGETGISTIHALKSVMKQQRARAEARAANSVQWDSEDPSATIDNLGYLDEGVEEVEKLKQPAVIKKNNKKRGAGGEHGKSAASGSIVECLKRSTNFHISKERSQCCRCKRPAHDPIMTSCYHFYCKVHYLDLMADAGAAGRDEAVCVKEGCAKKIDRHATIDPDEPVKPRWLDVDNNVLPSRKTLAIKAMVLNWLERDPRCKIIIFTQWRSFLALLARICEVEKWGYVTLHGGLNKKQKDTSIQEFKDSAEKKILIATLKTGGEGLNLTQANFVINVDPYWNAAAEVQAFSRVYRIGQTKETEFINLTLAGTIDEHLNAIKLRKKAEIDLVNAGHKRLTLQEMLKAFEPPGSVGDDSTLS